MTRAVKDPLVHDIYSKQQMCTHELGLVQITHTQTTHIAIIIAILSQQVGDVFIVLSTLSEAGYPQWKGVEP